METDLFVDGGDTISSLKNGLCDIFFVSKKSDGSYPHGNNFLTTKLHKSALYSQIFEKYGSQMIEKL